VYLSQRPLQYAARSGKVAADGSSLFFKDMRASGGGFSGNGCVDDVFSPGAVLCGTRRSSIPKRGSPVTRSNMNSSPIFVISATAGIVLPSFTESNNVGAAARS